MKNNLFWPTFQCKSKSTLTQEDIKEKLLNEKTSNLFRFSLLKSNPTQVIFSYNLMLIQILRVGFIFPELDTGKRTVEVKIRFSNIRIRPINPIFSNYCLGCNLAS
ncbi:hypothetical protein MM239_01530 [Belliella sp. DSM 111904]|uniref:Uncharacterized protein n=1 Tax=Belliella filtrata TaxID=2923435 RepID=A0ABS9UV61_9BACT|nr:hypothetical protein [Belliella filtrata]MCH7408061.1 hypothetical protein [Belliella filtrata]